MVTAWCIAPPTGLWCSVEDARTYLQFPFDTQDSVIEGQLRAAQDLVEAYCERGLLTQTWRTEVRLGAAVGYGWGEQSTESHADGFIHNMRTWRGVAGSDDGPGLYLRRAAPLQQIVTVTVDGAPLDPATWEIERTEPARLLFLTAPPAGRLAAEYRLGYGDTAAAIPNTLQEAMRKLMATYFLHREEDPVISFRVESRVDMLPVNVQQLLDPYRCGLLA